MIGGPLSSPQPSPFFQIGTMGWVGVLTRCMRAWHHVTTSQNIRQPLWSDPQLLRAGCPPVFNGGCIEAAMPIESVTDVLTVVSAPAQRLRSERPLNVLSETASERQQLLASCRILQRASSHCSDWFTNRIDYQIQSHS